MIYKVQPFHSLVHSKPHKVKGYTDDLTIISSSPAEHQKIITMMDDRCMDVVLRVRSGKCYSLLFDGKDTKEYPIIKLGGELLVISNRGQPLFLVQLLSAAL